MSGREGAQIASSVQHAGRIYVAREVDPSILRELHLTTEFYPNDSAPLLFADLVQLIHKYCGLRERPAGLVAEFLLADWVWTRAGCSVPHVRWAGSRAFTQLLRLLK